MSRLRHALALGATAGLIAGAATFAGGRATADASYTGSAEAGGLRLILANQSIPLNISPQVQGPLASATQNSLQQSDALAAFPYPGEDVAGLPGVTAGATGLPLPAYPFVAATSLGDQPKRLSYPGIELRAESDKTLTRSAATGGATSNGSTSTAQVLHDGDTVDADAVTDADVVRLGEALVLSGLHASATVGRDAAGTLSRASDLSFSNLSARGLTLTIPPPPGSTGPSSKLSPPSISLTDGKFRVVDPGMPDNNTEVPAAALEQGLTQAGYPTTYQQAQQTANGIIGAGLQIRTTLPAPPPGTPGGLSGETPVALVLGLVKAEISYQTGAAPAVAGVGVSVAGAPAAPPAAGPSAPAPAVSTATAPEPPAPLAAAVAALPVPAPVATAPIAPTTVELADVAVNRPAGGDTADLGWIYSLVFGVGVVLFGGAVVLSFRGVR